jgi:diguanylate cyclase (GGDEF)-like protein/PAS domain S-box-containing protein
MDAEVSAQLRGFVEQTADFVGVADGWGRVLYVNPAAAKRLGISDLTGLTLADVFPAEETAFYHDVIRPALLRAGAWSGEVRLTVAGEGIVPMWVSTTATVGPGGAIDGLVVHARDAVPVAARADDRSETRDTATGLLDRAAFDARVSRALLAQRRGGEAVALVLVDMSGADTAIETVGPATGATIVRSLARRLQRIARSFDVAGRVDDRHLALLLGAVRGRGEAAHIATRVGDALVDLPFPTPGGEVWIAVRCGASVGRPDDEPADLVERAASAIEPARVVEERRPGSPNIDEFRVALSLRELRTYARPVVGLRSGRLVGYRGTARWHHRRRGVLDAADFLEMAEATPLVTQLDLLVVRELAEVLALSTSEAPLTLSAPASTRLIADVRTEQFLAEVADAFHLAIDQIRLRIDRRLLDNWSPSLQDALESLRDAGVGLVLNGVDEVDDMDSAVAARVHEVYLSRALTRAAATDDDARRAVSEIVRLAATRASVVGSTGVDTDDIRDALVELGCETGSGDLFGPPVLARDID